MNAIVSANVPGVRTADRTNEEALFRREAVEHHGRQTERGDVLRLDPRWLRLAVWLLATAATTALAFSAVFGVDEYASGPAVVRVDGRRTATTITAGTVEAVEVRAGQRVAAGDVLVRLAATEETAELTRAAADYDQALVRYLVDAHDVGVRQQLSSIKARRDTARNAVEAKTIRAVVSGSVSDVRVKPGQAIVPGEVLCAVVPSDARQVSILALVPADYLPMLRAGLEMRFELDGFRFEYADVTVGDVSSEAIGPGEVARLLGMEHDGAIRVDPGGKVLVSGKLAASTFTSDGKPYAYFDGLTGNAEVRVRRESLLVTLIPALRRVWR